MHLRLKPHKVLIKCFELISGSLRLPGSEEPGAGSPHGGPQGDHPQDSLRAIQVRCFVINMNDQKYLFFN